jgi:AraC-like DNA-binding protein
MDALSHVLAAVHLSAGAFLHAEFSAPWCIRAQVNAEDCRLAGAQPAHLMAYHYVLDGRLLLGIDDAPLLPLEAGEIVLLPRNDPHLLASASGLPARVIDHLIQSPAQGSGLASLRHGGGGARTHLICGFLGCAVPDNPLVQTLPSVLKLQVGNSPGGAWIEQAFRLAAVESAGQRQGAGTALNKLAELLFIEAVRRYLEALPSDRHGWLAGLCDPQVGKALALLHRQPAEHWTTEALARAVGLSRSAFAERFSRLIGQPPIRYLAHWRLQLAAAQLREGRSLAQIAYDIGYGSEAALNRAFRQHYGQPPGSWRKEHAAA